MKCELCGREYINLGVHLRHKHSVDPYEYREEFGMLRTAPLVDKELSAHISASAKNRLKDEEYLEQKRALCRKNSAAKKKGQLVQMSKKAKELLAKRNTEANARYLEQRMPEVVSMLREMKTVRDISKALRMHDTTVKKIAAMAGIVDSTMKEMQRESR